MVTDSEITTRIQTWIESNPQSGNLLLKDEELIDYPTSIDPDSLVKDTKTGLKINVMKMLNYSVSSQNPNPKEIDEVVAGTVPSPGINQEVNLTSNSSSFRMHNNQIMQQGFGYDEFSELSIDKIYPSDYGQTSSSKYGSTVYRKVVSAGKGTITFNQSELDYLNGTQKKLLITPLVATQGIESSQSLENMLLVANNFIKFINLLMKADPTQIIYIKAVDSPLFLSRKVGANGPTIEELCEGRFTTSDNGNTWICIPNSEYPNYRYRFILQNSMSPDSTGGYQNWRGQYSSDNGTSWNNDEDAGYWSQMPILSESGLDNRNLPLPVRIAGEQETIKWVSTTIPIEAQQCAIKEIILKTSSEEFIIDNWETEIDYSKYLITAKIDMSLIPVGSHIRFIDFTFNSGDSTSQAIEVNLEVHHQNLGLNLTFDLFSFDNEGGN